MQFYILFAVKILHTYYDGVCKDFSFVVPVDTAQLIKNGKLIVKIRDGTLYVLFEADESGEALVPLEGRTLRIGLQLLNPFFTHFTRVDFDLSSFHAFYQNLTQAEQLDAVKEIALVGRLFSHVLSDRTRPVAVVLKNSDNQVLQTDAIDATNDRSAISYDLTGRLTGEYRIEEVYPGNTKTTVYYSDPELQQQGIFGVLEIKIDNNFYTIAPEFEITFAAKQETLKYYVVVKNYSDQEFNQLVNQLSVSDMSFSEEGRSQITFTKVLPAAFTADDLSPTLLGSATTKVALFKSQASVPRQQKARQKIQLTKNGGALIPHLPQPGADKVNADFVIQLTKP